MEGLIEEMLKKMVFDKKPSWNEDYELRWWFDLESDGTEPDINK